MRYKDRATISIIGAGRVGSTFAMLFYHAGYRIVSVISQKKNSARRLASLTGCKKYSNSLSDIHPTTRIILIAVPEENISEIVKKITKHRHLDFSKLVVFHTSGLLTSDVLLPLQMKGAMTFSLHLLQSFSKASTLEYQMTQMKNVIYGFEGRKTSFPLARQLVKNLCGKLVRIPKEEKILYHITCVFASNYLVTLLGVVDNLAKRISSGIELSHFKPLVRTSIENAFQLTPKMALTGPIARGSSSTVENHLHELRKINKPLSLLYQRIGLEALKMVVIRKSIKPKIAKQIRKILES